MYFLTIKKKSIANPDRRLAVAKGSVFDADSEK